MNNIKNMEIDELRKFAKQSIDALSFDDLAKIVDKIDDIELFYYIISRMDRLDHKRFIEFYVNY